jgi:hypothetical protein
VLLRIVVEQADRALAVPELERCSLVLALAVRLLNLQNGVLAVRGDRRNDRDRGSAGLIGLAEDEPSALDQTLAGQR